MIEFERHSSASKAAIRTTAKSFIAQFVNTAVRGPTARDATLDDLERIMGVRQVVIVIVNAKMQPQPAALAVCAACWCAHRVDVAKSCGGGSRRQPAFCRAVLTTLTRHGMPQSAVSAARVTPVMHTPVIAYW